MTARGLHRGLALALGLFLVLHLCNHLAGLAGQSVHGAVQDSLRPFYRHPLVEPLLLGAVAVQTGLGLRLWWRRRTVTLQAVAGGYLALFLAVHLGAVLAARWQGIDTDLAFAAAGLHAPMPWPALMGAHYGLGLLALSAHLAVPAGRAWGRSARHLVLALGAALALAIPMLLAGTVVPLTIPTALIAAFP